ncbi:cell division protein FtsL [Ligilactobacillus sp. WC1T17]|uniref:Cell division protein FtsL n=1 Tax=Ligilactobacillus ruminis TaxID=1623 RepID=A0ABY1AAV4_9LACO|nr:cell division protein FtsL [Ligilactobacillus ruminis]
MNNAVEKRIFEEKEQPQINFQPVLSPYSRKFRQKKIILTVLSLAVCFVCGSAVVSTNSDINRTQIKLEQTEKKAKALKNKNDDLKLKVAELTNSERLSNLAKQAGLKMNDSKIRNVNK